MRDRWYRNSTKWVFFDITDRRTGFFFSNVLLIPVCWNLDVPPVARTFPFDRNNLFCACSQFAGCGTILLLWVHAGSRTPILVAKLLKVKDFGEMMSSQGGITTSRFVLNCISNLIAVGFPLIKSPFQSFQKGTSRPGEAPWTALKGLHLYLP